MEKKRLIVLGSTLVLLMLLSGVGLYSAGAIVTPPSKIPSGQFEAVWNAIIDLQNQITNVQALESRINTLEARIAALEANQGGSGEPDFDSGWITLSDLPTFVWHYLGTDNIRVCLVGRYHDSYSGGYIVTQKSTKPGTGQTIYPYWMSCPNPDGIWVFKDFSDPYWNEVRVLIWELPPPPA